MFNKSIRLFMSFVFAFVTTCQALADIKPTLDQSLDKNYVINGGFENGAVGYKAYKNTAQAMPVSGTGGTPATTIATTLSSPIAGKASGVYTHAAANLQGEGVAYAFKIDPAAQGRVITISGLYSIISGTYSGGTSSTDSGVEVYVYDVDAAQIIQPAGYKLDGGVSGLNYPINATFQTNLTSVNYRLLFHNATATTSAFQLKIDSLKVGTAYRAVGVIPKSSTSTVLGAGSGNYVVPFGVYQLKIKMVGAGGGGGASGTSGASATIGGSTSFGPSLLTANGGGFGSNTGSGGGSGGSTTINSPAIKILGITGSNGGSAQGNGSTTTYSPGGYGGPGPFGGASGSQQVTGFAGAANSGSGGAGAGSNVSTNGQGGGGGAGGFIEAILPVSSGQVIPYVIGVGGIGGTTAGGGASGGNGSDGQIAIIEDYLGQNVTMSDSAETRVIAAYGVAAFQTGIPSGTDTIINYGSSNDETGSFNNTTHQFTVPVPGYYDVYASAYVQFSGSGNAAIFLYVNGVSVTRLCSFTNGANQYCNGPTIVKVKAGDVLDFRANLTGSSPQIYADGATSGFTIKKVSGPSQIAASESVSASYSASSNISLSPTGGANFDVKNYDTHNAVTTGNLAWKFTAPESGKYSVSVTIDISASTSAFAIYKNGILYKYLFRAQNATGYLGNGNLDLDLLTGDYIDLRIDSGSGSTVAAQTANNIYIKRIGN